MKSAEQHPFADIHCHVIPGVDDGSKDMAESLKMLRTAAEEGITDMILTPHFVAGHAHRAEAVRKAYAALKERAEAEGIPITFYPGNEIYYLEGVPEALESGAAMTLAGTRYVLVEFGPAADYMYIRNAVGELRTHGFKPVLAHMERYIKLLDVEKVRFLRDSGARIQINAAAVSGAAGFGSKRFVRKLLDEGLVDFVGTDAHNSGKRKPEVRACLKELYDRYEAEYADAIVYGNAKALMNKKELL